MSPAKEVCVDASLAVKVAVTEPDSDKADALFEEWSNEGMQLITTVFFDVETDSILRQKVVLRGKELPVILIDLNELHGETAKLSLLPEYLDKVLKLARKETTR